jgi:hypothetical protein
VKFFVFGAEMSKLTNKVNRFGFVRNHAKPKTEEEWANVYARHAYVLPSIQEMTLRLSRRGKGVAGLRRFRFDVLPAVVHHNQAKVTVEVDTKVERYECFLLGFFSFFLFSRADLSVKLIDGTTHEINCYGKRDHVILDELYKLDPKSNKEPYIHEKYRILTSKAQAKD